MSARFDLQKTPVLDLTVVQRKAIGDRRGYLERMFCVDELQALLAGRSVAQINHTLTEKRGTVRGMHYQLAPHVEAKFISCLRGEVFDVVVDLRPKSSTYLQWHAEVLNAIEHKTLFVPEGFAHGFQTLTDDCEMLYLHTAAYAPTHEAGLNPQDPKLGIEWPFPITDLSPRDAAHPMLTDDFLGVHL